MKKVTQEELKGCKGTFEKQFLVSSKVAICNEQ